MKYRNKTYPPLLVISIALSLIRKTLKNHFTASMKTAESLTELMNSVSGQVQLLFHKDSFAIFVVSKVCQLNFEESKYKI